jgi:hypothetical protein
MHAVTIFLSHRANRFYMRAGPCCAVMTNWLVDYQHALLVRLLGLAVVLGVIWPGLWLLLVIRFRSASRLARHIWHGTRIWHGHMP